MMFGAPKSVSVLWALLNEPERQTIEHAHRTGLLTAAEHLERTWAWARRGGAGWKEQTPGLLMAQFDHHTSRAYDPHIHTHTLIFNLAPRWDGSWGAVAGRELYRAQKDAGAVYQRALASELERLDYRLDFTQKTFRVAAIPYDVERAFSKRRQAIEEAACTYGYTTAKGVELARVWTLQAKQKVRLDGSFTAWEAEAKALGFELGPKHQYARSFVATPERPHFVET
jgi:conjugative relaxase-like TrwC/TraI family protein